MPVEHSHERGVGVPAALAEPAATALSGREPAPVHVETVGRGHLEQAGAGYVLADRGQSLERFR